ncbi:MAG: CHAD domain-containing protein [Bacteroidota bacterium]
MPEHILTYFRKHKQIIEENLQLCADPKDIEAVHQFRLSVKRIRVAATLTSMICESCFDSKTALKDINRLFKRSGRLRDVQVSLQLLAGFNKEGLAPVIALYHKRERKQRLKFEKALDAYNNKSLDACELIIQEALAGISAKRALSAGHRLLADMESDIRELFHGSKHEKRLHAIRTRLKSINYLNNIFDEQLPVQEYLNISVERLRELGELAGAWHDSLTLEKKITKFIRKSPDPDMHVALRSFVKELKTRKQELQQEYSCILMNEVKI